MIKDCKMRHENGNCLPAGGFCTANKNICDALHHAYEMGRDSILATNLQPPCNQLATDLISKQWLLKCIDDGSIKFDTEKDTNRFIHLVRDIAPTIEPERMKRYCRYHGIMCEYATEYGYCQITACVKRGR